MLPEALSELVHEAGGEELLLDSKHSRAIVSGTLRLVDICRNLRHHGFTHCIDFSGEHLGGEAFALRLVLRNPRHGFALLNLKWKFKQTAQQPAHPTLSKVWPAAGVAEREMFEMLGLPFAGHENLKPLLLEEQFAGNPLRKDYALPQAPQFAAELLRERHEQGMVEALSGVAGMPHAGGEDGGHGGPPHGETP